MRLLDLALTIAVLGSLGSQAVGQTVYYDRDEFFADPTVAELSLSEIDFDRFAPGTDLTGQSVLGVTLNAPGTVPLEVIESSVGVRFPMSTSTPPHVLSPGGSDVGLEDDDLEIVFPTPIQAAGIDVVFDVADGTSNVIVTVFDEDDNVLVSAEIPAPNGAPGFQFVGAVAPAPIVKRVVFDEIDSTEPDDHVAFDPIVLAGCFDDTPGFIAACEAETLILPPSSGDGAFVEVFNGIGGGPPPRPADIQDLEPDGVMLSPFIDFPNPGQVVQVGQNLAVFFAETTVPPDEIASIPAANFILRITGLLRISSDLDLEPATPEIDIQLGVGSDDGFHLIVGETFIDEKGDRAFNYRWSNVDFETEGLYPVTLLFAANSVGQSGLEFAWNTAIAGSEIIPQDVLYLGETTCEEKVEFEEFDAGTLITDQYNDLGIRFEVLGGDLQITDAFPDEFIPVSGDRVYGDPNNTPAVEGVVEFTFVVPGTDEPASTDFFSLFVIDTEDIGSTITAFAPDGTQIYSEQVNAGGGTQELVTIAEPFIARVVVTLGVADDTSAIDNICFDTPTSIVAPDLQVTALNVPAEGVAGQPFQVAWTVANEGLAAADGPWSDSIYLSDDDQLDAGDTVLSSLASPPSLDPDSEYERIQQLQLPSEPGEYWIIAETDSGDVVDEVAGEGNNIRVASMSISVAPLPLPDLVVESIIRPSSGVLSGSTVEIQYVVRNIGTAPTIPTWTDLLILSVDEDLIDPPAFLFNEQILSQHGNPQFLLPGESYLNTVVVTLPNDITGTFYIAAYADGRPQGTDGSVFAMTELDEGNNVRFSEPFEVTLEPQPDLIARNIDIPAKAFSAFPLTVEWTVENQGDGVTDSGQFAHAIYFSENDTPEITSGDILFKSTGLSSIPPLPPGQTSDFSASEPIDADLFGTFYVKVFTDSSDRISEFGFENNNVGVSATTIEVILSAAPDLIPSVVTATTANPYPGQLISVSWAADNKQGAPPPFPMSWKDGIYLSSNPTFEPGVDTPLGSFGEASGVDEKGFPIIRPYEKTRSVRLPDGLAGGDYYLIVNVDDEREVFEGIDGGEANNTRSTAAAFTVESLFADLTVSLTRTPETSGPAGGQVTLDWQVANSGEVITPVAIWRDRVYFSTDETLGGGDQLLATRTRSGALEPGESYDDSAAGTIPLVAAGSYFLLVVTDSDNTVLEGPKGNANNVVAFPFEVTGDASDLVVDAVDVARKGTSGDLVSVAWTVRNDGALPTNVGVWQDRVWLSVDKAIGGADDIPLGARTRSGGLAAGDEYDVVADFSIPIALSGTFFVLVQTDSQGVVFETDDQNNTGIDAAPLMINAAVVANLVVGAIDVSEPAVSGQPLEISWEVSNGGKGSTNVSSWNDSVYLSLDQFFDGSGDIHLGTVGNGGQALESGQSYVRTRSFTVPLGVSGPYFVIVRTDSSDAVFEDGQESDNTGVTMTLASVTIPDPSDLVPGVYMPPSGPVTMGEPVLLEWTVRNVGDSPVNGQWSDSLYLSPDAVWDLDDTKIGTFTSTTIPFGPLEPGESLQSSAQAVVPGVVPGDYFVLLRTDVFNNVPETDEFNNCCGFSIGQVNVGAIPLALSEPDSPMPFEGTLQQGQERYFELVTPSDETVRITLDHSSPNAWTELYVKFGSVPSPGDFDLQFNNPGLPDQEIVIPNTQAGTYYILAKATTGTFEPGGVQFSLLAERLPFQLLAVEPTHVGAGSAYVRITGGRLDEIRSITVTNGVTSREAIEIEVVDSATIRALFDFSGISLGSYDVRGATGAGESVLPDSLSIESPSSFVTGQFLGVGVGRKGVQSSFLFAVQNNGNINVDNARVNLYVLNNSLLAFGSPDLPEESVAEVDLENPNLVRYALLFQDIGPGESQAIQLTTLVAASAPFDAFSMFASLDAYSDSAFLGSALLPLAETVRAAALELLAADGELGDPSVADLVDNSVWLPGFVNAWNTALQGSGPAATAAGSESKDICLTLKNLCEYVPVGGKAAEKVCTVTLDLFCRFGPPDDETPPDDDGSAPQCSDEVETECTTECRTVLVDTGLFDQYGFPVLIQQEICECQIVDLVVGFDSGGGPIINRTEVCPDIRCVERRRVKCERQSSDPNEKIGPIGFAAEQWTAAGQTHAFTIHFENVASATAPAARVEVRDDLDVAFNSASFRVGDIVVGDVIIDVPENQINYSDTIDLIEQQGVLVEILAGVNAASMPPQAFWIFQAIDPDTGEPPTDGFTGFLPPEDGTGVGQGYVEFTIKPKADVVTGTVVENSASIVFDTNEPIITNTVFNTIDADLPESTLDPLPAVVVGPDVTLTYSGFDPAGGSGLAGYNLLVSIDGSPLVPFTFSSETTAVYVGEPGHIYGFSSQAVDNAGNVEEIVADPDAVTAVPDVTLAAESDSGVVGDDITNDATPTILVVSAPMTDVFLSITGGDVRISTKVPTGANGRGTFTVPDEDALPDGQYLMAATSFGVTVDQELRIDTTAPTIDGWASALVHGSVGEARIPIDESGSSSEPRQGGISTVLLTYPAQELDIASLLPDSVTLEGRDEAGNSIDLSGVTTTVTVRDGEPVHQITFTPALPDKGVFCITLVGVTDAAGNGMGDETARRVITGLRGDATGDRRVNNTDVGGVLSLVGTDPIDPANPLHVVSDVDTDGDVDGDDVQIVLAARGTDVRSVASPCVGSAAMVSGRFAADPDSSESGAGSSATDGGVGRVDRRVDASGDPSHGDLGPSGDVHADPPVDGGEQPSVKDRFALPPIDVMTVGVHDPTGRIDVRQVVEGLGFVPAAIAEVPIPGWWTLRVSGVDATVEGQRIVVDELTSKGLYATPALVGEGGAMVLIPPTILVALERDQEGEPEDMVLRAADAGMTISQRRVAGMDGVLAIQTSFRSGFDVLEAVETLNEFAEVRFAEPDAIFTGSHSVVGIPQPDRSIAAFEDRSAPIAAAGGGLVVVIGDGVEGAVAEGADFTSDRTGRGAPVSDRDASGTTVAGCVLEASGGSARIASARTMITADDQRMWYSQVSWTLRALEWAGTIGADITNNSNAYGFASAAIAVKYQETSERGVLHFAMVGDDSSLAEPAFPARVDGVHAVGSVDAAERLSVFSTRGPAFVGAGEGITASDRSGKSGFVAGDRVRTSGTGLASAHVAGAAAALVTGDPGGTRESLLATLRSVSRDLGEPGFDRLYGWGLPVSAGEVPADAAFVPTDVNRDGRVTIADLVLVLDAFGGDDSLADVDRNGIVDDADLLRVIEELETTADWPRGERE